MAKLHTNQPSFNEKSTGRPNFPITETNSKNRIDTMSSPYVKPAKLRKDQI